MNLTEIIRFNIRVYGLIINDKHQMNMYII